jgi:hypothetical protein
MWTHASAKRHVYKIDTPGHHNQFYNVDAL